VARWFNLKRKIPIWVHFGGSCIGRCWYALLPFGLFYGHVVYF
jgi:mannitol-1-phosphate/altronate dehydrogenase